MNTPATRWALRPLQPDVDADEVARLRTADTADWPSTGDLMRSLWQRRDPARRWYAWVAEQPGGRLGGYGFIEDPDIGAAPHRLRLRITVDPPLRGQGIGRALFEHLWSQVDAWRATEILTEAGGHDARTLRFLAERGFKVFHTRVDSALALDALDAGAVARGIDACTDRLAAAHVRIATLRQWRMADALADHRLHALFEALWQDVPFAVASAPREFETFVRDELEEPGFAPQACFIAHVHRDWIGLSNVTAHEGFMLTTMTGVLPRWRGHGIARWLKLHTIRYALERRAPQLRTVNDAQNTAMIGLNRALGFVQTGLDLRLRCSR